jgi:tRNA pseudouridine38-40 synthase
MRVAIQVEYDGTRYSGFQYQLNTKTIQGELENSIEKLTGEQARVYGAGRTDSGVHALGQVVVFNTNFSGNAYSCMKGMNYYLPEDIAVKKIKVVSEYFDPRRDALARFYRYTILNSDTRSPIMRHTSYIEPNKLNIVEMNKAADLFVGIHDFSRFSAPLDDKEASTVRKIEHSKWNSDHQFFEYNVKGNAFLPRQVRRMTGALVDVGKGLISCNDLEEMILGSSEKISNSLPPQGLCLVKVIYQQSPFE